MGRTFRFLERRAFGRVAHRLSVRLCSIRPTPWSRIRLRAYVERFGMRRASCNDSSGSGGTPVQALEAGIYRVGLVAVTGSGTLLPQ